MDWIEYQWWGYWKYLGVDKVLIRIREIIVMEWSSWRGSILKGRLTVFYNLAFTSSWYIPSSGIAGSSGAIPCLIFWGTDRLLSKVAVTVLQSHQQGRRVPVSPSPGQQLWLSGFLLTAFLVCVRWYLILFLLCLSLMANNDVERIFRFLLSICVSSLENYTFKLSILKLFFITLLS